jgi:hypothetical protein
MRKFLFLLASTATLAMINPAVAQMYLPPAPGGIGVSPGYTAPGYNWREQRANDDWRNNSWREQRFDEDSRNNNWREQRANDDWRQREDYEKRKTPNNAIDRGYVGGAKAIDRTNNNPTDTKRIPTDMGYVGER